MRGNYQFEKLLPRLIQRIPNSGAKTIPLFESTEESLFFLSRNKMEEQWTSIEWNNSFFKHTILRIYFFYFLLLIFSRSTQSYKLFCLFFSFTNWRRVSRRRAMLFHIKNIFTVFVYHHWTRIFIKWSTFE